MTECDARPTMDHDIGVATPCARVNRDGGPLRGRNTCMAAYTHHVFVCENRREPGHARGCCESRGAGALRAAFKAELKQAGLARTTRANGAGCLDQCEHGPVVVIYPQGIWYGGVRVEDVPRIVSQTLLRGEVLDDLRIDDDCLNNPDCPHRRGRRLA